MVAEVEMANRDIHTKKDKKKPKKDVAKRTISAEPVAAAPVEVVRKHRKETVPE